MRQRELVGLEFETFCADPQLVGEPISPAWAVFYRAVEGLPLDTEQEETFRLSTGREHYEPRPYQEATAICGRRSEKTSTALKYALWKSLTGGYERQVRRGELLRVPVVAQDLRIARDLVRSAKAMLLNSPVLGREVDELLKEEIRLRNGLAFTCYPCTFRAPRGPAVPVAVLDELGFWQVEGANPDREVLAALRPASIQFGEGRRILKLSTPWMKSGVLWTEWQQRAENPGRLLLWQAPTERMTPRISPDALRAERESDLTYYAREYEAQFTDDLDAFLPGPDIDAAVGFRRRELRPESGRRYLAAVDASSLVGRDRFTLGIAHQDGERLVLDLLRGWQRAPVPQVCDELATIAAEFRLREFTADQYAHSFLAELLRQRRISLRQLAFSARSKPEIFFDLKLALAQGWLELLDQAESLRELRSLEAKRLSGGSYKISAPRGGRDDFATVVALLAHEAATNAPGPLEVLTAPGRPSAARLAVGFSGRGRAGWMRGF